MTYDYGIKKTVIAVASKLTLGTAANVIGHLALAVGHRIEKIDMGRHPLIDGSGVNHLGISRYPVIVVTAKTARLGKLLRDARHVKELLIADFPEQILKTSHDDELASALTMEAETNLNYLGVALHGLTNTLKPLTGNFSLWGVQVQ